MIATKPTTNGHGPTTSQNPVAAISVVNPNRGTAVLVGALFSTDSDEAEFTRPTKRKAGGSRSTGL